MGKVRTQKSTQTTVRCKLVLRQRRLNIPNGPPHGPVLVIVVLALPSALQGTAFGVLSSRGIEVRNRSGLGLFETNQTNFLFDHKKSVSFRLTAWQDCLLCRHEEGAKRSHREQIGWKGRQRSGGREGPAPTRPHLLLRGPSHGREARMP